jgi:hypothetical protein
MQEIVSFLFQRKYLAQFRPKLMENGEISTKSSDGFGFSQIITDELSLLINWTGRNAQLAMNTLFLFKGLIFGNGSNIYQQTIVLASSRPIFY